ncbi:Nucleotide-binding protein implicated in inhibition of septum formation [Comamonas testosteroni TK102]|uniref:Nucleotide-binding protein implicated in inhibition of septum formation n=1 Tax=Comamonas testosteroni TK102 TaxID=1392005 RepID=A0A076PSF3_COMTE|nr:Nucleotide-binding protein implicated in inhibition of septum formation [Comamonas testosteroni TK102]
MRGSPAPDRLCLASTAPWRLARMPCPFRLTAPDPAQALAGTGIGPCTDLAAAILAGLPTIIRT